MLSPVYRLRKDHNITQTELSNLTGVNQRYISEIELGLRAISPKLSKFLAKKLNIDESEIIKNQENFMLNTMKKVEKKLS